MGACHSASIAARLIEPVVAFKPEHHLSTSPFGFWEATYLGFPRTVPFSLNLPHKSYILSTPTSITWYKRAAVQQSSTLYSKNSFNGSRQLLSFSWRRSSSGEGILTQKGKSEGKSSAAATALLSVSSSQAVLPFNLSTIEAREAQSSSCRSDSIGDDGRSTVPIALLRCTVLRKAEWSPSGGAIQTSRTRGSGEYPIPALVLPGR